MKMNMLWVQAFDYMNKKKRECDSKLGLTSRMALSTMSILAGLNECQKALSWIHSEFISSFCLSLKRKNIHRFAANARENICQMFISLITCNIMHGVTFHSDLLTKLLREYPWRHAWSIPQAWWSWQLLKLTPQLILGLGQVERERPDCGWSG